MFREVGCICLLPDFLYESCLCPRFELNFYMGKSIRMREKYLKAE